MKFQNKDYDSSSAVYGLKSIKFKLKFSFGFIFLMAAVLVFLSTYTFEMYFNQIDYYSSSYYELIDLRNSFNDMNSYIENYWKNHEQSDLINYNSEKNEIDLLIKDIKKQMNNSDNDEESALMHAVCNSYQDYIGHISTLVLLSDSETALEEYYEVYQKSTEYINIYIETLLNKRFVSGQSYYENLQFNMHIFRTIEISSFVLLILAICYILFTIFRNIVYPILIISAQSREIALGNFDVDDIQPRNPKNKDEITNLILMFNHMKNNLKNMFETSEQNLKMAQELIKEQKRSEIIEKQLRSEKYQNEILFKKANYDNLTQIFNRNAFEQNVKETIEIFDEQSLGALFVIDVDNFKSVNDTLGHQGGDEVLKSLAYCLSNTLADCGFAGRWGGDEFVGFISKAPNIHFIRQKASDLCCIMNKQFMFKGIIHHISISVGVCPIQKGDELKLIYSQADEMLYDVKEAGRNNFKIYMADSSLYSKEF